MSTESHRWIKFWPQDWQRDPALRICGLAARGLWMELMCLAHEGEPYGHVTVNGRAPTVKQIGLLVGVSEAEASTLLDELETAGVFSRDDSGVIFSRRMVRDKEKDAAATKNGKNGGNPLIKRGTVNKEDRVRPYRRNDSPQKTERIFAKRGGRCWWCDRPLQRTEAGPDFFHVDHLIPVCDGGTNDESNLVPACAECNHARARVGWVPPKQAASGVNVGIDPTLNSRSRYQERTEAIASDAGASGGELPLPAPTAEPTVWNEGIDKLIRLGLTRERAGAVVGKLVKRLGGDKAKALEIVRACPDTRAPEAWIGGALKHATRPQAPCLNDDAEAWAPYADPGEAGWAVDSKDGKRHPVCGGYYLDVAAALVGEALGLRWDVRYDWDTLAAWMREFDFHAHILPILKRRAAWNGYTPPDRLKFFDSAIRNGQAR